MFPMCSVKGSRYFYVDGTLRVTREKNSPPQRVGLEVDPPSLTASSP